MVRKGQVALEFIMTYGWAILALLAAISALSYFGVLNPQKVIPDKCIMTTGFSCLDFQLAMPGSGSEVEIQMKNDLGSSVVLSQANVTYRDQMGNTNCGEWITTGGGTTNGQPTYTLDAGDVVFMTCNAGNGNSITFPAAGERGKIEFQFEYRFLGKPFTHVVNGEIIGTIEE